MTAVTPATKRLQTADGRDVIVFKNGFAPISPFHPSKFEVGGKRYYTAHHYYLALKARFFNDPEAEAELLKVASPREACQIAEYINNLDESKWEERAADAMFQANLAKMRHCFGPRRSLLGTASATIVFGSEWDLKFGTGLSFEDDGNAIPSSWKGLNMLGQILVRIREELKK